MKIVIAVLIALLLYVAYGWLVNDCYWQYYSSQEREITICHNPDGAPYSF